MKSTLNFNMSKTNLINEKCRLFIFIYLSLRRNITLFKNES